MYESETKALVPYRETVLKSIDGYDLMDYFQYKGLLPARIFPPHIDLSIYTEGMTYLYDTAQLTHVFPEDVRQNYLKEMELQDGPQDSILQQIRSSSKALLDLSAEGERHICIYHDPDDDIIKYSPISHGEYDRVQINTFELASKGKNPLFAIHTHPYNTLFSPQDYFPMIYDAKDGEGMLKGQLVLCPDNQILALATDQTPHLKMEEAERLINEWSSKLSPPFSGRLGNLYSRLEQIKHMDKTWQINNFKETMDEMVSIDNEWKSGKISEEDAMEIFEIKKEGRILEREEATLRLKMARERITSRLQPLASKFTNEVLIEFARLINVKLYISTNRSDFKEFSA